MFDEFIVAGGSVVEMGEAQAQQVSWRINDRLIQILKYTILLLLLFLRHSNTSSLLSANGSSKSPSASKALRIYTDKHPLLAMLLGSLFC